MDVHPSKNGINRYWPIPICTVTTDESRCDLHSRHADPGYWFNRTWHSGCILNNSTMIQSNLYDSIRVRNMYTYSIYIYIYLHTYIYIYIIAYIIYIYIFIHDSCGRHRFKASALQLGSGLDIASIKTSPADPLTFEVPTFRPNMSINSTPGSSWERNRVAACGSLLLLHMFIYLTAVSLEF